MRSTNLYAFTTALRLEFPEAQCLRLRRASRGCGVVYQLVGLHGSRGRIARQLVAATDSEAFHGARTLLLHLNGRGAGQETAKGHERAAIDLIASRGYRDATERAKVAGVREVCRWLTENALELREANLRRAVLALAPDENRKRRSVVEAASLLAEVAGVNLDTEGLRYRNPLPTRRPAVDDDAIFEALDTDLLKLGDPGAIWTYKMVAVTGIRANGCLSLQIPEAESYQPGIQLPYWDSKRGHAGYCTPTVKDWWDKWELALVPSELQEFWMPHDRPASNEQVEKANNLLTNYAGTLRRRVHKDAAESLGFRALRHAATARLLKSGMQPLLVADLLSTSLQQVEATYSDHYRQHAVTEAARLL